MKIFPLTKRLLLPLIAVLTLMLAAGCGDDKPKESADKAVLAYAELYAYADTDKLSATGMTEAQKKQISQALLTESDQMFQSFMLSESNAMEITDYYIADRKENMELKAKVKKDDAKNPVVELTATPIDTRGAKQQMDKNEDLVAMGVYIGLAQQQGVDVRTDATYQQGAVEILKAVIDDMPYDSEKTLDVTCELVKSDDGKALYWAPKDPQVIRKFLDGE